MIPITLESLAVQIAEQREALRREIEHVREIVDQVTYANQRALQLQAQEYERRLEALNHEAQRISRIREECVPIGEYKLQIDALLISVQSLEKHRANLDGRVLGFGAAMGAVVTLINIALRYLP